MERGWKSEVIRNIMNNVENKRSRTEAQLNERTWLTRERARARKRVCDIWRLMETREFERNGRSIEIKSFERETEMREKWRGKEREREGEDSITRHRQTRGLFACNRFFIMETSTDFIRNYRFNRLSWNTFGTYCVFNRKIIDT